MSRLGRACAVLMGCFSIAGCSKSSASVEKTKIAVRVKTVESGDARAELRYAGTLEPAAQVEVAYRASGYVEKVGTSGDGKKAKALDIGDFVKKGTLLARIRSADYAQRVVTAKAKSAEARASAKLAEQDLSRAKKLFEAAAISKADYDAKAAHYEAAVASADGASAMVGEASLALDDTRVLAPMDGVVVARNIEEGTLAHPGGVAFVIADTRTVKVVFGVPQSIAPRLHPGDPLAVVAGETFGEGAERPIAASIARVAPAADAKGRVFTIEASLDNANGALRPGSVVSIRVPGEARADGALLVPLGAVVRSPGDDRGFAVFVAEGRSDICATRIREVALGDVVGNSIAVTRGLERGDRVVVTGASLLTDGGEAVVIP